MSELKGSLLGIILVLMLFGTVSLTLTNIFADLSSAAVTEVSEIVETTEMA